MNCTAGAASIEALGSAPAEDLAGELLRSFGWPSEHIVGLGNIPPARGTEAYLLLWLLLRRVLGTGHFNVGVVR